MLLLLPFCCFTNFSIPLLVVRCLRCFVQLSFMFFWCPFTIIDNEPCSIPFRLFPWTNLSSGKLDFLCPPFGLRIMHPWRGSWFRQSVINGRWSNQWLWKCCLENWRSWCSCLSCIDNISHLCHPTRHRPWKKGGLAQFRRGRWKVLDVWKHTITGSPNGYRMENQTCTVHWTNEENSKTYAVTLDKLFVEQCTQCINLDIKQSVEHWP